LQIPFILFQEPNFILNIKLTIANQHSANIVFICTLQYVLYMVTWPLTAATIHKVTVCAHLKS